MKQVRLLLIFIVLGGSLACANTKEEGRKTFPMFWTWLDYRPSMNFDSICSVIKETGIDGLLLNAPTPDDYRAAIPVARKHGIEVYAWLWTMNLEHDRETILKEHPEWFSVNRKGESLANTKAYVDYYKFMCPALPEVREYIKNKIRTYCEVEGLDGIAIDYHRFVDVVLPTTLWPRYAIVQDKEYPEWDYGYHPAMIKLFMEKYGYDPCEQEDPSADEKWLQFRCDQITEVANEIADVIHSYDKVMAASPFPTPAMARAMVRQDWGKWNLDIVFPMVYHNFYTGDISFIEDCTIDNVKQKNPQTTLFCGMMSIDGPGMFDCMDAALNNGAEGIAIFTINSLRSPEVRKKFRIYTDKMKSLRASGKIQPEAKDYKVVKTNPFDKGNIMEAVNVRMKAYLSLAKASKLPEVRDKDWDVLENRAINAMQINTADEYIKRLSFSMGMNQSADVEMTVIANQFKKDDKILDIRLGEYNLINETGTVKYYQVTEQNSKVVFTVAFYFYGGIISGWNVKPEKTSYEKYKKEIGYK